jgi:uncharacterized protein involved in exopolysaccharide biosynthesis
MDQSRDENKPAPTSYRETFRRHRKLLCLPVILGALAAAFFLFGTGRTYKSTANVWVDTNPPAQSSLGTNSLAEPPAAAEQTILGELLTTRAFRVSVAETASGGKPVSSRDVDALGNAQVTGIVTGGQVLQISATAKSAATARNVLGAVVAQLRSYTHRLVAQHQQAIVADGTSQVKAAEAALATARRNLTAYQTQHPQANQTDPTYESLVVVENNATTQLAQANTALGQAAGAGSADGWSVTVIDPASPAITAPLRKSKMAEVVLGGIMGGVLVSFLAVVALTPAKKEAWEDELPIGRSLVPDVPRPDLFPVASPGVPTAPAESAPATTGVGELRVLLGERRLQLRTAPARSEER